MQVTTISPISAVISPGAKRSEAKREISRTYATSYTTALQEPSGYAQKHTAVNHTQQPQASEQPVANSPANADPCISLNSPLEGGSPQGGGCMYLKGEQPVTISPSNPMVTTISPISAVISPGAKRSEAKREISRTYATSYTTALQEPSGYAQKHTAVNHAQQSQASEQPVANSPSNADPCISLNSPLEGGSPQGGGCAYLKNKRQQNGTKAA